MQNFSTLLFFVNKIEEVGAVSKIDGDDSDFNKLTASMDHEPSEQSIKNILDFARSYDVLETESTGYVEMNLN